MLWYNKEKVQTRGFQTEFEFRITPSDEGNVSVGSEGFAFVIQNSGDNAEGGMWSGLGYGDYTSQSKWGIENSLAIEFDTFLDSSLLDWNNNHISVHTLYQNPNSANESVSLAHTIAIPPLRGTGNSHKVLIEYVPNPGTMKLTLDDNSGPVLSFNVDLDSVIGESSEGLAWIGFSATTGATSAENHDLLSWSFSYMGEANSSTSFAYGPGTVSAVAGSRVSFTIQAVDQWGNNLTFGNWNFLARLSSQPLLPISLVDSGNGEVLGSYTPTLATSLALLSITLNGIALESSPYRLSIAPGPISPRNCVASNQGPQTGLVGTTAGVAARFSLSLQDQFGNVVTDPGNQVIDALATLSGPTIVLGKAIAPPQAGILVLQYVATISGIYSMKITVQSQPISNSMFNVSISPGSIDGSQCVTNTDTKNGIAGAPVTFQLFMKDTYGNNITNVSSSPIIDVLLSGSSNVVGNSTYLGEGSYEISYLCNISGPYTLFLSVNNQPVIGSPFQLSIEPATQISPKKCFAYGDCLNESVAGLFCPFSVQTKDYLGNNITKYRSDLLWDITMLPRNESHFLKSLADSFGFNVDYVSNGVYNVSYNTTVSDAYLLHVFINGTEISGSPFQDIVFPGPTYARNCYAFGTGLQEATTDVQESFIIQSSDRYNNLKRNGDDPYEITIADDSGSITTPNIIDNMNGSYLVLYTLGTSGHYIITITLDGEGISGSPFQVQCKWVGLSSVAIILIVSGCIVLVAIIVAIFILYRFKNRKKHLYQPLPDLPQASD